MKWKKGINWTLRIIFIVTMIKEGLNWHSQYLLASGLLLTFVPLVISKIGKVKVPINGQLFVSFFVFGSQYLGSYKGFYGIFHWWDMLLHTLSGALIGYWLLVYLLCIAPKTLIEGKQNLVLLISFLIAGSVAGAGLWEIFEFMGDTFLGTNAQLGSLKDTMGDIICGTIGGGLFATYIGVGMARAKSRVVSHLLMINSKEFKKAQ